MGSRSGLVARRRRSAHRMMSRLRAAALVFALFSGTVGAYWYWSPLWVVRQMHAAARAGDGVTFNEYVDYDRVRDRLSTPRARTSVTACGSLINCRSGRTA